MAFQGSLAELHLPDIIQLVSVSGKTGVFHLVDGPQHGEIWLSDGKIVHAEVEDLGGEEAVYALAIWRSGEFKFDPGAAPPRQTIQKSNTNLLMEAARRLDEWRVLSRKIPSVELVPEFIVLENREGQINLNTMEWLLLSKIDGQRTVRQIATTAGMGVFDAAKLLYGLVAANLIRLKESAGSAAVGVDPPARDALPSRPDARRPGPVRLRRPTSRPPSSPAAGTAPRCSSASASCATSASACSGPWARASCRSTTCARAARSSAAAARPRSTRRSSRSHEPPASSRAAPPPKP